MPVGIKVLLFDIGGVLLSKGWETASRKQAADDFGLDASDFEQRHQAVSDEFEAGKLSLDGYLTRTVFYEERPFARDDFVRFMQQQSEPYPESLDLVRRLARTREYLIATLNNKSRELNDYRIGTFRLSDIFTVFLSSCYLGIKKPDQEIYHMALDILQCRPDECLFIDDREVNLGPAELAGMRTVHCTDVDRLRTGLASHGVTV